MFGKSKFERPGELEDEKKIKLTPEEKSDLILERSSYLVEHKQNQDARIEHLLESNGRDPLTGAASRETFDQKLETYLKQLRGELSNQRSHEEGLEQVSLIMMDIDHFKSINDTLGHEAGDDVLKKTVEALIHSVRDTDMVARRSGEEFFVLMKNANLAQTTAKAEELRAKIESLTFEKYPALKVTASFGVASSDSTTDKRILEDRSDMMMYKAKRNGRNRVEIYSGS